MDQEQNVPTQGRFVHLWFDQLGPFVCWNDNVV